MLQLCPLTPNLVTTSPSLHEVSFMMYIQDCTILHSRILIAVLVWEWDRHTTSSLLLRDQPFQRSSLFLSSTSLSLVSAKAYSLCLLLVLDMLPSRRVMLEVKFYVQVNKEKISYDLGIEVPGSKQTKKCRDSICTYNIHTYFIGRNL